MLKKFKIALLAALIPYAMQAADQECPSAFQPFPSGTGLIKGSVDTFGFFNTAAMLGIVTYWGLDQSSLSHGIKKVAFRLGALTCLNVVGYCAPHVQTSSLALSMAFAAGAVGLPICVIESKRSEKKKRVPTDTITTIKNLALYGLYVLAGGFMVYNYNALTQPPSATLA